MAKIPFNIKYRPEIESGKYKVVTSTNKPVRIVCWDRVAKDGQSKALNLCVLISENNGESCYYYYSSGEPFLGNRDGNLFILTDEPELTKFEMQYAAYRYGSQVIEIFGQEQIEAVKKEWAAILAIAREELQGDMPHWYHIEAGCAGNGDILPVYLTKDQYGCYALTTAVVGGDDYLLLSELDKLPKS